MKVFLLNIYFKINRNYFILFLISNNLPHLWTQSFFFNCPVKLCKLQIGAISRSGTFYRGNYYIPSAFQLCVCCLFISHYKQYLFVLIHSKPTFMDNLWSMWVNDISWLMKELMFMMSHDPDSQLLSPRTVTNSIRFSWNRCFTIDETFYQVSQSVFYDIVSVKL